MELSKKIGLALGPIAFLILNLLPFEMVSEKGDPVIAIAAWMLIWWITEAVSISVTALLPLLLMPILNVLPIAEVGANYGSPIVFLFFGGFVMALALEKVNLHRRIALNIIKLTGTTPNKVILGFMIATATLSMWISNTASTVVMLPIALSVINLLINDEDGFTKNDQNFALSVMLGIAFSANAGGIATVIGTPPNSVLIGLLENEYNTEISFFEMDDDWIALFHHHDCHMLFGFGQMDVSQPGFKIQRLQRSHSYRAREIGAHIGQGKNGAHHFWGDGVPMDF